MTLSDSDSLDAPNSDELVLRIKASYKDVEVRSFPHETVADLKQAVRIAFKADNRYLRLICRGRLLAPDNATLKDFSLRNGEVVHAVLAAPGVRGGQQAALARGTTRRFRGTGVNASGRVERSTSDDDDEEESDEEDGRERIGFDRLRSSGLSRHEITAIRTYFSRHVERYMLQHPLESDEPDVMRRRQLSEDIWMAAQGPASEFRLNLNTQGTLLRSATEASLFRASSIGTDRDFMWGFLLGFFVGFLMLVWVWMPSVPHKQKLGILTGISLQLGLSLLRARDENEGGVDLEDVVP